MGEGPARADDRLTPAAGVQGMQRAQDSPLGLVQQQRVQRFDGAGEIRPRGMGDDAHEGSPGIVFHGFRVQSLAWLAPISSPGRWRSAPRHRASLANSRCRRARTRKTGTALSKIIQLVENTLLPGFAEPDGLP